MILSYLVILNLSIVAKSNITMMKNTKLIKYIIAALVLCLGFSFISIQTDHVRHAAKLIGLELTDLEIDSLKNGIENSRKSYLDNRALIIPNSTSPALVFDPKPIGFDVPQAQQEVVFKNQSTKLPTDLNELAFYSIAQLASLIKDRKISSLDLTKFYLARLKKYDPTLHCVISLTEELALQQARKADEEIAQGNYKGLLHGIPYGAKDLLATKTYKTTWGAAPFKDQSFDYDATVVKKLEEAGAVLCAKLTLGALAWGDVWYGEKTRNPWDTSSGSSGSSAGSASSVSAGLLPFAIGTETLGSIVSPSTVCGDTGLRPTFGTVSRYGAMALSWSMDKIGPICRTVEDCAIVYDAIRGEDALDNSTTQTPFNYNSSANPKRLRVGYLKSDFESAYRFKKQDSLSLLKLRDLGIDLIPIKLPELPSIRYILEAEAAAAFDELTRSGRDDEMVRQIKRAWPNVFRTARFIPAVEYIQANRLRSQLIQEMHEVMQKVDVYVTPSWTGSNLTLTNLTGHPQLVLPNGFIDGKPTSISFVGQLYGEADLLTLANYYQENTDHHLKHPSQFR